MDSLNTKEHVRRAIRTEWAEFARHHPRLAAVLEEDLLVERAAASLMDDPQYRQAMERAATAGAAGEALAQIISRFISHWLRHLD